MAQTTEMMDGSKKIEFFKKFTHLAIQQGQTVQEEESEENFRERMLRSAQVKLRNPEVNKFYQIRCGRNEPCPCGSGKKFKKCCWGKCNQGEIEIDQPTG